MAEYNIETDKYDGVDTVKCLIDLANDISKAVPNISFKRRNMNTWGVDKLLYPQGVCESLNIFHNADINNHVGVIEVSNYYRASDKPKYAITSINIDDGRNTYGGEGNYKYSIHSKNIIRIAKKAIKPFTFDQIADRCRKEFKQKVESIGNNMRWELRQNTCDGYEHLIEDWENLFHMGYEPSNAKFKKMMEYVMANKAKIDKYHMYDPKHYFVLVKDNEVQYRLNTLKGEQPTILSNKDALPDDIKGKLFVLDITEGKDFVEDIGLKENDGAYWIIA
jgi:hypothetical protein